MTHRLSILTNRQDQNKCVHKRETSRPLLRHVFYALGIAVFFYSSSVQLLNWSGEAPVGTGQKSSPHTAGNNYTKFTELSQEKIKFFLLKISVLSVAKNIRGSVSLYPI